MDRVTANQERLPFAKVCVLVYASKEIPFEIGVKLRGVKLQVRVEVPWTLARCSHYIQFGHNDRTCLYQVKAGAKEDVKQKWMPKANYLVDNADHKLTASKNVGSNHGRAGSEIRFSILSKVDDGDSEGKATQQLTSVVVLMGSIKARVQESLAKRKLEEGLSNAVSNSVVSELNKSKLTPIQGKQNGGTAMGNSLMMEDKVLSIAADSSSEDDSVLSKRKPILPISNLVQKSRLASLGVHNAIAAVKTQNKNCKRQAKKASAKQVSST
ncbi:hypothetical protein PTKIN_Ptkin07bG0256900 [Pterospermum kingtungense]